MRVAFQEVYQVAGGIGEDNQIADLNSLGKLKFTQGDSFGLRTVGAS